MALANEAIFEWPCYASVLLQDTDIISNHTLVHLHRGKRGQGSIGPLASDNAPYPQRLLLVSSQKKWIFPFEGNNHSQAARAYKPFLRTRSGANISMAFTVSSCDRLGHIPKSSATPPFRELVPATNSHRFEPNLLEIVTASRFPQTVKLCRKIAFRLGRVRIKTGSNLGKVASPRNRLHKLGHRKATRSLKTRWLTSARLCIRAGRGRPACCYRDQPRDSRSRDR